MVERKALSMNAPLITTIIPTFRRPEKLKRAIESVLRQTYPHFQVCVYDNASGDSTSEVAAQFSHDPRIKYFCHDENIGAVENFQFGLSRVETPIFSFLSDDDYLLPKFYEIALGNFAKHPKALFSMGAVIDVDEKGQVIEVRLSKWPEKDYYSPPEGLLEMIGKYSNWTGILFRKEVIESIGSLDLQMKAIDVDYALRAAAAVPFAISKEPCAVFVQSADSYSGSHGFKLIYPGWPMMISKIRNHPELSSGVKDKAGKILQNELQELLFMNAVRSLAKRNCLETFSVISTFKQEGGNTYKVLLLIMFFKMCQALPISHLFLRFLLQLRRQILRKVQTVSKYSHCDIYR